MLNLLGTSHWDETHLVYESPKSVYLYADPLHNITPTRFTDIMIRDNRPSARLPRGVWIHMVPDLSSLSLFSAPVDAPEDAAAAAAATAAAVLALLWSAGKDVVRSREFHYVIDEYGKENAEERRRHLAESKAQQRHIEDLKNKIYDLQRRLETTNALLRLYRSSSQAATAA